MAESEHRLVRQGGPSSKPIGVIGVSTKPGFHASEVVKSLKLTRKNSE